MKIIRLAIIPLFLAITGAILNLIVITANSGMPVLGISPGQVHDRWITFTQFTHFKILADILPFYLSIGDVLMIGSVIIFLTWLTTYERRLGNVQAI